MPPLLPAFGTVQLRLISREAIQTLLLAKLKEDLSWATVKHIRTVLGTLLATAELWGYIDDNPVRKTRLPRRGSRPEKQILTPEQLCSLLQSLPEPTNSIIWLLVLTGLRIGELLALRWRDIDLDNRLLCVRQTVYEGHFDDPKTRTSKRTVPLFRRRFEILRNRRPETPDAEALVFSSRKGTAFCRRNLANRQLAPTCQAFGFPPVTWHALRHCNATLMDSVQAARGTVSALLGHSSEEITARYVHSLPQGAREALEKVGELLTGPKRTQIAEIENLGSTLIQ